MPPDAPWLRPERALPAEPAAPQLPGVPAQPVVPPERAASAPVQPPSLWGSAGAQPTTPWSAAQSPAASSVDPWARPTVPSQAPSEWRAPQPVSQPPQPGTPYGTPYAPMAVAGASKSLVAWVVGAIAVLVVAAVAAVSAVSLLRPRESPPTPMPSTQPSGVPSSGPSSTPPVPSGQSRLNSLRVGDCFEKSQVEGTKYYYVSVVDCTAPHDAEVFYTGTMPDGTYPTEDAVTAFVVQNSADAFSNYVGIGWADTRYGVEYYYPAQSDWTGGGRWVVVFTVDPAGDRTTSVRGTRQ